MLLQLVGKRHLLKLLNTKKEKERRRRRTLLPLENLLESINPFLYARCDQSYGKPVKTGGDKSRKRMYEKGRGGGRKKKKEEGGKKKKEKEGVQQESRYKKEEEL